MFWWGDFLVEDKPIMNTIALLDNLDKHLGSDRFFGWSVFVGYIDSTNEALER